MKKFSSSVLLLAIICFAGSSIKAQTLEETLTQLSSTAGSAYVEPIISAFGSNLNSGWVSGAPSATKLGLDFNLRFIAMGSFFTDANRKFETSGTFRYTSDQVDLILNNSGINTSTPGYSELKNQVLSQEWEVQLSGPTIVGNDKEFLQVTFPGDSQLGLDPYSLELQEVSGYLNELSMLPTAAAQLDIGTVFGTKASFRWFPEIDIQDLGKFKFFGFGLMHNPEVWLNNPLPIDLAVGFFTQNMKVGTVFESSATQYGLWVSKTFGIGVSVTPYAGITMESSTTTVAYDYTFDAPGGVSETARIKFDLDGKNKTGFTIGANLSLIFVNLNVDYKIAETNTAAAGLSFGF